MPHPYSAPGRRELVLPAANLFRTDLVGLGEHASVGIPIPSDRSGSEGMRGQRRS